MFQTLITVKISTSMPNRGIAAHCAAHRSSLLGNKQAAPLPVTPEYYAH